MSDRETSPSAPGSKPPASPNPSGVQKDVKVEETETLVTPDGQVLDLSITGNLNINVDGHSPVKNSSRWKSLKYGIAGLIFVVVREASIKFAAVVTLATIAVGIALHVDATGWGVLSLALGQIWITECLNTAIEAAINLGTDTPHPVAKIGKDVGSAASVIATLVYISVAVFILGPRALVLAHHLLGHG